ncbi:MAG: ABC transporter substrate-binding protein [Bacteroidales bacterium]|nr:ABC transporter substrate-binding protein [Bacteroidales bacterium]
MNHRVLSFTFSVLMALCLVVDSNGQDKKVNYGKTPDELIPYGRFQKAYINFFDEPMEFNGAGREKVPPTDLTEVRIGLLGPLEGSVLSPQGIQMLQGATLALEEANKKGGYKGIPYKILPHNDVGLWGAAANEVVKMNDEKVWAFLGTIDDINTHVALRVALKLELPMVNSGDPDPTLTETRIPWMIRIIGDDRQSSYALVNHIYREKGHSRVAVLRADNRYGRVGVMEFRDAAQRIGFPLVLEIRFADGDKTFTTQLERIKNSSPDAVLLWGNATETALIVKQMREMGLDQPVYGSDRLMSPEFLEIAGKDAEGVVTTCQYNPNLDIPELKAFQKNYKNRFGIEPDVFAAHAYDGMNIIFEAIQIAGLNRALIRDVLTDLKTFQGYQGVTGELILDASWNDIGPIWMTEVKNGKFEFYPAPPLVQETSLNTVRNGN